MNEPQSPNPQDNGKWQQEVLTKLVFASVNEQRRARRWSIFFKAVFTGYLFLVLFVMLSGGEGERRTYKPGKHTSLIEIKGVIAAGADASADNVINGLRDAFDDKDTAGIILRINSPGGSPVQAGYINDEIKRLRGKHPKIKVYAVITDICASGGYYIASAADEIYADKASLVGSIGVLMDGFGFTGAMQKLGVERRLLTAGVNKGFLDPFSPADPKQEAYAKQMLEEIHGQFIAAVRAGRGKRLKETPDMFSGLVWSGEKSIQLGLADGYGTVDSVARDVIKAEDIVDYTQHAGLAERLVGRLGVTMGKALAPFEKSGLVLR